MSTENQNQITAATAGCAAAAGYVVTAWRQAGNGLRCMPQPRIAEHPHRSEWPTKEAARTAARTMQDMYPGWHWQITNPHTNSDQKQFCSVRQEHYGPQICGFRTA